jgi:hypothetical protein
MTELPNIGAPATRALKSIKVTHLEDLTKCSEAELLALYGMGPKALKILKAALEEQNLYLAIS